MSNFNSQEINFIKRRGNKACGKIYLALCNGHEPEVRNNNFDDYLRLKYQVQKWYELIPISACKTYFIRINKFVLFFDQVPRSRSRC